ncbi:DUF4177 domain-containing protein [Aliiroseovarius sp.]|uniref:DUF4177 domain-containing protein n=1 Tax=Aliiroseovarius sp. TaxID=1872442 RepID=UPI003BA8994B
MSYEYKVVPAPVKGVKAKGVKGAEAQFAHALSELMNSLAADGWEYQRADTLPSEVRSGLTGKTTVFRNMLVFRRAVVTETATVPVEEPAPLAVEKIAETHAPALPSAHAAQELPEAVTPLDATPDTPESEKREVAAE